MAKISVLTSLYNCDQYLTGYFDALNKITNLYEVEVLLLHNEPSESELFLIKEAITCLPFVRHIVIPKRESLYATWNRGIKLANGKYIAVWNVDDVRIPNSLFLQSKTLDEHPEETMTYGDMILNTKYGSTAGKLVQAPAYPIKKFDFLRSHYIGCFPMWRKEIHNILGYFDEQFRLVGDYEFQIRVVRAFPLVKTEALIGYYLTSVPSKLSSNSSIQNIERTAVEVRYGVFDKMNLLYIIKAIYKHKIFVLYCKFCKR